MQSFKKWAAGRFSEADDMLGNFVRDMCDDRSFPGMREQDREHILDHLAARGACREAVGAFKTLWALYELEAGKNAGA